MIAALMLAAAPAAGVPTTTLNCRLVTPSGHAVAFAARLKAPGIGAVVLDPVAGTVWPAQRVIGGGTHQMKATGIKSSHRIAGEPGVDLQIDGEVATLFIAKKLRRGLPRAHGFCLPDPSPAAADGPDMAAVQAGAAIPAFDPATWPDHCTLLTRSGRRWKIDYTLVGRGAKAELRATSAELFGDTNVLVSRRGGRGKGRFTGGKDGPSGSEELLLELSEGVKLINFERTALPGGEPAAAICGMNKIVRRATPA
jgi:hypothetical protein